MRTHLIVFYAVLVLMTACSSPSRESANTPSTPSQWQPEFWDQTLLAAKQANGAGDKLSAETLCAQGIHYVEQQAIRALFDFAGLQEGQMQGSGQSMHIKAQQLEQMKAQQARATQAGSRYLGFVPWVELDAYADSLTKLHREIDATAIRRLGAAYKYTQEAFLRRALLMRDGKDPRGEC